MEKVENTTSHNCHTVSLWCVLIFFFYLKLKSMKVLIYTHSTNTGCFQCFKFDLHKQTHPHSTIMIYLHCVFTWESLRTISVKRMNDTRQKNVAVLQPVFVNQSFNFNLIKMITVFTGIFSLLSVLLNLTAMKVGNQNLSNTVSLLPWIVTCMFSNSSSLEMANKRIVMCLIYLHVDFYIRISENADPGISFE